MDGVDILGLITGIFSILSVPIGVIAFIYNLLPCTRLRELEQIFSETEDMLHKTAEAGLLGSQRTAYEFQTRLEALRASLEDVRVESHCAATYAQNFKKMLAGLSRRIFSLCAQVKMLRADISTTSARERERLRQANTSVTGEPGADGSGSTEGSSSPTPSVECLPSAFPVSVEVGVHKDSKQPCHRRYIGGVSQLHTAVVL
ncbi:hypothetical protein NUW54_g638 [Trametes sanguinea]|uniref:Uncharacterized protein n=1 Tax=Trametes sanguinea TaxID=158606 RepID=A0ACC1QAE0_9APHY|nr:hypothetical protein NUW54_g638 [Trametes sanguinea]